MSSGEPHPMTTAHAWRRRQRRRGIAIVEVVVALSVLVVAASIFCQMLLSTSRLRQMNRENALATDAARVVIEEMRNRPFLEIYRAYNEDAKDDPGGQGTAPGYLFHVPGLTPLDGAPQDKAGRIVMPSTQVQVTTSSGTGGGKKTFGTGTVTVTQQWHLREDYVDTKLGMPRDLNGNNVVDTANHSSDYLILPVRVVIQWKSATGPRRIEVLTQLGDFVLEDGS
jgi:type II secretory pathway pseudopilin PulG